MDGQDAEVTAVPGGDPSDYYRVPEEQWLDQDGGDGSDASGGADAGDDTDDLDEVRDAPDQGFATMDPEVAP